MFNAVPRYSKNGISVVSVKQNEGTETKVGRLNCGVIERSRRFVVVDKMCGKKYFESELMLYDDKLI